MRKDGRTVRHNEANSCFSQFCERAEKRYDIINFLETNFWWTVTAL